MIFGLKVLKMDYKKEFDSFMEGSELRYAKANGIPIESARADSGYGRTNKPQEDIILRDPFEFEILQYFPKEYASMRFQLNGLHVGR